MLSIPHMRGFCIRGDGLMITNIAHDRQLHMRTCVYELQVFCYIRGYLSWYATFAYDKRLHMRRHFNNYQHHICDGDAYAEYYTWHGFSICHHLLCAEMCWLLLTPHMQGICIRGDVLNIMNPAHKIILHMRTLYYASKPAQANILHTRICIQYICLFNLLLIKSEHRSDDSKTFRECLLEAYAICRVS